MNQPPHQPNQRFVWVLVLLMLFSAFMLVWLNKDAIQEKGASLRATTQAPLVEEGETSQVQTTTQVTTVEEAIETTEAHDGAETSQQTETTELEVTTTTRELTLKEKYAQLPEGQEYSIYQYNEDRIDDLHVKRGFEVMIERLKEEGKFYSTVDYHLTFYPTLDENISNITLDEYYADKVIHRGHYRFDYRAKKVAKY
ncbi:hypothetical protein ACWOBX_05190 [Facklamia languida]